jgi:hypothetical protein
MNLLQASYFKVQADLHAGGPGSGRRSNEGSRRNKYKSLYKILENKNDDGIFHTLDKANIPLEHKIAIGKRFGIVYSKK